MREHLLRGVMQRRDVDSATRHLGGCNLLQAWVGLHLYAEIVDSRPEIRDQGVEVEDFAAVGSRKTVYGGCVMDQNEARGLLILEESAAKLPQLSRIHRIAAPVAGRKAPYDEIPEVCAVLPVTFRARNKDKRRAQDCTRDQLEGLVGGEGSVEVGVVDERKRFQLLHKNIDGTPVFGCHPPEV